MSPAINGLDCTSEPILEFANTKPPRLPEGTLQDFSPQLFQPISYSERRKSPDSSTLQDLSLEYLQAQVQLFPEASGH